MNSCSDCGIRSLNFGEKTTLKILEIKCLRSMCGITIRYGIKDKEIMTGLYWKVKMA